MAKKTIRMKKFALYLNGVMVGCATDVELNITRAEDETTCIDSGDFDEFEPGSINWNVSVSGTSRLYTAPDATTNVGYINLTDHLLAGTILDAVAGSVDDGDDVYTGKCWVSNINQKGSNKASGTYSCSLRGTGPLTKATQPVED
jgi:hypothetical protein